MIEKLIATLKEHESRLNILVNHRDLKPQLRSYIQEFLLNKDFEALMAEINKSEEIQEEPTQLEAFIRNEFGIRYNKTIWFSYKNTDLPGKFRIVIPIGDNDHSFYYDTMPKAANELRYVESICEVKFDQKY